VSARNAREAAIKAANGDDLAEEREGEGFVEGSVIEVWSYTSEDPEKFDPQEIADAPWPIEDEETELQDAASSILADIPIGSLEAAADEDVFWFCVEARKLRALLGALERIEGDA
jgi:hypothetical protein